MAAASAITSAADLAEVTFRAGVHGDGHEADFDQLQRFDGPASALRVSDLIVRKPIGKTAERAGLDQGVHLASASHIVDQQLALQDEGRRWPRSPSVHTPTGSFGSWPKSIGMGVLAPLKAPRSITMSPTRSVWRTATPGR